MNSWPTSPGNAQPPFVAEGGVPYRMPDASDPVDAWIQLMEVIEALCPQWPQRGPSLGGTFLL
jgi:hypothetical protein